MNDAMNDNHEKLKRLQALLRRRKRVCIWAMPAAVLLLVLPRILAPELPQLLGWILLLGFAVACVVLLHSTDSCPWCGKTFHSGGPAGSGGTDAAGEVRFFGLLRDRCAHCGQPHGQAGGPAP